MATQSRPSRNADLLILVALAALKLALYAFVNGQYGFHRDELATVDDARNLAWGYVAYPPVTPFIARIAFDLFGPSLVGLRFFAVLAQSIAMVLAGLIARELGGRRAAQVLAALAVAIAPVSVAAAALFQYVTFDYLWWVLAAYLMVRLLNSEDPRWWVAIGAVIGVGMLTKYTMAFLVAGIVAGVLLTPARRWLRSGWLWFGVALSILIFLPNFVWLIRHDFISLKALQSIHARDIRIGRTGSFLVEQFYVAANPFMIPLWAAGGWYYFRSPAGKRYRLIGWMCVIPVAVFWLAKGRSYYAAPAYPALLAAGAVVAERWVASLKPVWRRLVWTVTGLFLAAGGAIAALAVLPLFPVNSPAWNRITSHNGDLREEIGWPELTRAVADVYASLPPDERAHAGILAGNYGEAGAIDLYGPGYGLPRVISGVNSYWLRGYGEPPPQTLVVVGLSREFLQRNFETCQVAGHVSNRYGVKNEESTRHPDIFICRRLRQPWPEFWKKLRSFG